MEEKKKQEQEAYEEVLVRIFGQDIPASKNVYAGLTRIKGVSWSISNALCHNLHLDRQTKVADLGKETIGKIEHELKHLTLPTFLMNRRADIDTGENRHILSSDLDMRKEFDIKRLKKMKSYRGVRHAAGLPVRGQKTRSHFRKKGVSVGVSKKKDDKKA